MTMLMQPFSIQLDLIDGILEAPDRVVVRRASDMRGYYSDVEALDALIAAGDPVHYRVYERAIPETPGHLLFCISVLNPGTVGVEYYMTKGHYHTEIATAETYLCLRGEGVMLMKTADGKRAEAFMMRGRLVYVPPTWAHRSVNTGQEPLVSFCVYPAHAGHNYGDIATEGFPQRLRCRDGKPRIEP
jgi:glucose-6-phosphate isomerase